MRVAMMRAAWAVTHKTLLMYLLADEMSTSQTTVNSFFPGDVKSDLIVSSLEMLKVISYLIRNH